MNKVDFFYLKKYIQKRDQHYVKGYHLIKINTHVQFIIL